MIAAASRHFQKPEWQLFIHVLAGPEESFVLAAQAARKKYYAVIVAGGDGTINEVAGALVSKKTLLGVIPSGTGNGLARALGMPLDFDRACLAIIGGKPMPCDVGIFDNGRVFINVCGVGMDAWIAHRANELRWVSRYSGFLRYLFAGLHSLFAFKHSSLRVTVDGQPYEGSMLLAVVANSEQYGFGTIIAPGAKLDDGQFDVLLVSPLNFQLLLKNFFRLYAHKPLLGALRLKAKSVEIAASNGSKIPLHLDGEPAGGTPMSLILKPGAIRLIAPSQHLPSA